MVHREREKYTILMMKNENWIFVTVILCTDSLICDPTMYVCFDDVNLDFPKIDSTTVSRDWGIEIAYSGAECESYHI